MNKIVTLVSAMAAPEGMRVGYTYSEVRDDGEIASRHNAGAFIATGAAEQAAVQTLMDAAAARLQNGEG